MSRQQKRAAERKQAKVETRRQAFDRLHGTVLAGRTVRDLWLIYARNRFGGTDLPIDSPEVRDTIEHGFYAGAATMLELMTRVSPDEVSEDEGVEMLQRLHEELEAYSNRSAN